MSTQIDSYTDLVNAIKAVTEDDSNEFVLYIPTAVDLAEERLLKELDLPELETQETNNFTSGAPFLTKPANTDLNVVRHLWYTDNDNKRHQLKRRTIDYCYDYWPDQSETDLPKYYAIYSDQQYFLVPTPDDNYSYEIRYLRIPDKLTATNPTNYFITHQCRECLFYACMVQMTFYMKAWEQIQYWEKEYQRAAESWNYYAMRQRRDGSTTPLNPEGNINSLRHTIQATNA